MKSTGLLPISAAVLLLAACGSSKDGPAAAAGASAPVKVLSESGVNLFSGTLGGNRCFEVASSSTAAPLDSSGCLGDSEAMGVDTTTSNGKLAVGGLIGAGPVTRVSVAGQQAQLKDGYFLAVLPAPAPAEITITATDTSGKTVASSVIHPATDQSSSVAAPQGQAGN
jgi:hypothetical protein